MPVVDMTAFEYDGKINIFNIFGTRVVDIGANKGDGLIEVCNRQGETIGVLP